jgi:hypothetical protein
MALLDTRSKRVLAAVLAGLGVSFVIFPFVNQSPSSIPRLGDLPGFYALGRIVLEGQGQRLYDFDLQREIQNSFWPSLSGSFFPTMYPPVVAAVMAPLSMVPTTLIHSLLSLFSFFTLCALVRWQSRDCSAERLSLLLLSLPTFISIVGPQTTIISLFCITYCRHFLLVGRNVAAGLCAGLLMYKPQIGVPFALVTTLGSPPRFLLGFLLAAAAEYGVGVMAFGGEWLVPWATRILPFSELRGSLDQFQFTAITGGLAPLLFTSPSARLAQLCIAGGALGLYAALAWRRIAQVQARDQVIALFLATSPVFLPQTNFYDLAIPLFVLLIGIPLSTKPLLYHSILMVIAVNVCTAIRSPTLSLVPIASLIVALVYLRRFSWAAS